MLFTSEPKFCMSDLIEFVFLPQDEAPLFYTMMFKAGSTVQSALDESGLLNAFPSLGDGPIGIFSKRVSLDTLLQPGDRVEFYRPLLMDPKDIRRLRAKHQDSIRIKRSLAK